MTSGSTTSVGVNGVGVNGWCEIDEEAVELSPRNNEKGALIAALAFLPGRYVMNEGRAGMDGIGEDSGRWSVN